MNSETTKVIEHVSQELRLRLESEGVLIMIVGTEVHCCFNCKDRESIPRVVKGMRDAAKRIEQTNQDMFD